VRAKYKKRIFTNPLDYICNSVNRSNSPIHMMVPPYYNIEEIGNIARI
jgi:hypothetical protein